MLHYPKPELLKFRVLSALPCLIGTKPTILYTLLEHNDLLSYALIIQKMALEVKSHFRIT